MMRIILVRHGETIWHAEYRYCGVSDVELSPAGFQQANQFAAWCKSQTFDAIYVSPLRRAIDTASPVAAALGIDRHVDPRLRELDFGQGEGLTPSEMATRFPQARDAFEADPVASHLPGGEDPRALVERGKLAFNDMVAAHPNQHVLVIAHTTFIRLMLCHWLGVPLKDYRRVFPKLDNLAVTEFDLDANLFALRRFNAACIV